mmetsp:Transcript_15280/g.28758  ORF Transcript_15280/g.28758 Transcript_15280/m.28758 type:complete len:488 (-) Transcript_15280:124-1587(-)
MILLSSHVFIYTGLTMGLMSIEKTKLEIIQMTGSSRDSEAAKTIIPLLNNHHLLLVTLLLFNAVANEAMPVFLEKLVPPYMAVILSVSLVLIFGEIIPSALFTGKNQILLAAQLSSFVYFLLYVLYPVTFPISKVLDYIFGHPDDNSFSRNELEALVILQNATCRDEFKPCEQNVGDDSSSELTRDEIGIMTGVLRLSHLTARDAMIPIDRVSMISSSVILDEKSLQNIMTIGFSRYPVFEETDREFILGYLLVKKLIVVNPSDKRSVTSLELLEPIVVHPSEDLLEMLNIFQEGKSHLALVSDDPETTLRCIQEKIAPVSEQAKVQGIITLENIIEKIIQEEIFDETDRQGPEHGMGVDGDDLENPTSGRKTSSETSEVVPLLTKISSRVIPFQRRYGGLGSTTGTTTIPLRSAISAPRRRKSSLSVRPANSSDVSKGSASTPQWQRIPTPHKIQRYSTFDSLRTLRFKSGGESSNRVADIRPHSP